MGWGTSFTPEIFLNKHTFHSREELIDKIKDLEESINTDKSLLKMYAISTPTDIIFKNDAYDVDDVFVSFIQTWTEEILEDLIEDIATLTRLNIFLEHIDENPDIDILTYIS